jgi:hypothetical protein
MDNPSSKSAADKKAARSSAIEEQIREQQKRKQERAFLEELAKRISIAREGKHHSDRREFSKALSCYRRFLAITAQALKVEWDSMSPSTLDEGTRSGECLLISSILFDMLKILDKMDTPTAQEERKICHRLFIKFTLGQNFQNHAAENLRKYLVYRKTVVHKAEFWATYNAIRVKKFCVVASWAFGGEDHPAVGALRAIRDERLAASAPGRAFVRAYYAHGERLLAGWRHVPGAKPLSRAAVRGFVRALRRK